MFHQLINSPALLKGGHESFNELGYWCHPHVIDISALSGISTLVRKAVEKIKSINKVECDIRFDDQGNVVAVSGLDLVSEELYDFARAPVLVEAVEKLLRMASISIHVKYLNRTNSLIEQGCWCQDQATNESHFDELALSVCIPIVFDDAAVSVNEYGLLTGSNLLAHQKSDFTETAWKLGGEFSPSFIESTIPCGGAVFHSSLAVYRPALRSTARELLVLNYRRSPYRQQLRDLHQTNFSGR